MPCKAVLCCRVCKDHKASIIVIITENEEAHLLCSWSDWWKYMDGNASIFLVIPHKQEVGRWSSFGAGVGIGGKFYRKQVGKLNHKNPYVTDKNAEDVLTRLEQRKRQAPTHAKRRWRSLWKLVQAPLVAQEPRSYHIFLTAEYLQHPCHLHASGKHGIKFINVYIYIYIYIYIYVHTRWPRLYKMATVLQNGHGVTSDWMIMGKLECKFCMARQRIQQNGRSTQAHPSNTLRFLFMPNCSS